MAPFSPETLKMLRGALKKSRLAQICRLKGRNTFENLVRAKPSFGGGRWDSTPKGWGPLGNHPLSWVRMPRMHCLGKKKCAKEGQFFGLSQSLLVAEAPCMPCAVPAGGSGRCLHVLTWRGEPWAFGIPRDNTSWLRICFRTR